MNKEEKMEIKDSNNYQEAIEQALKQFRTGVIEETKKLLAAAETWLDKIRNDEECYLSKDQDTPDALPGRWLDHREYVLFKAFRSTGDFRGAQRIIDGMKNTPHNIAVKSKEGRQKVLNTEKDAAKR